MRPRLNRFFFTRLPSENSPAAPPRPASPSVEHRRGHRSSSTRRLSVPILWITSWMVFGSAGRPATSVTWNTFMAMSPLVVISACVTERLFSRNTRVT
uniref:Uncharacterized protein n=1 Tax=Arundo donax TaxID=35708 RepID=A0A0A9GQM2_ARUDO